MTRTTRLFDLTRPYDRDELVLGGEKLGVQLGDAVQALGAERTMDGASTLTMPILDPGHALLDEDELLGRKQLKRGLMLEVDDYPFRLMELQKRRFGFECVFYDGPSAQMKLKQGALKASRDAMTRPRMIAWMCRLAGAAAYIPQVKERPLIADLEDGDAEALRAAASGRSAPATRSANTGQGKGSLKSARGLTVKGKPATPEQRRNMEHVMRACDAEDAPPRARLAAALAPIGESSYLRSAVNPRSGARAVFQLLASTAREYGLDPGDTYACARQFLRGGFTGGKGRDTGAIALGKANPGASVGKLVFLVEGSDADGAFYDAHRDEAVRIVEAWTSGGADDEPGPGGSDRAYVETYELRVDSDEDYLEAGIRFAEEVRWRLFSNGLRMVYADDLKLAESPSMLKLVEGRDGCDELTWLWTARERIDEVKATIRLARWQVPPGGVVTVAGEGSADGRYLLRSIERDLLDEGCSAAAVLGRPQPPLPEPAPTVRTVQGTSDADGGGDRKVDRAYTAASRISDRGLPYVWGGGHARAGTPDGGTGRDPGIGYDCSGYVVAILAAAGLGFKKGQPGTNSTGLESWGQAGKGKYMTVWANAGHTFIEFDLPGKQGRFADTSREAAPPNTSGPRLRSGQRSTAGYVARHWPGT